MIKLRLLIACIVISSSSYAQDDSQTIKDRKHSIAY